MRDRFLQQETWERLGVDVKEAVKAMQHAPDRPIFQAMLFSKIVPNCKKLGLLDAGDGWLRDRFTELGVIQFEDWVDTGEEYAAARRGGEGPSAHAPIARSTARSRTVDATPELDERFSDRRRTPSASWSALETAQLVVDHDGARRRSSARDAARRGVARRRTALRDRPGASRRR